jgi:hypothetical protein
MEEFQKEPELDFSKELEFTLSPVDSEVNRTTTPQTIYLRHLELLIKLDLRYVQMIGDLEGKYEVSTTILNDTCIHRCLYANPQYLYLYHFLKGKFLKSTFYSQVGDFMRKYADKFERDANHRYEQFASVVPVKKLPPGRAFLNLPLYSKHLRDTWQPFLEEAKESLLKAVEVARQECVYGEFALDLAEAAYELSEVFYLLSEYRPRLDYKYFDFEKEDQVRAEKLRAELPDTLDD